MDTGVPSWGVKRPHLEANTRLHLVQRLGISGATPPLASYDLDVDMKSVTFVHPLSQNLVERLRHCRKPQLCAWCIDNTQLQYTVWTTLTGKVT